jgi:hypothetical protein
MNLCWTTRARRQSLMGVDGARHPFGHNREHSGSCIYSPVAALPINLLRVIHMTRWRAARERSQQQSRHTGPRVSRLARPEDKLRPVPMADMLGWTAPDGIGCTTL